MRLTFPTQQAAQTRADSIYAAMQAANALEPGTVRWAIPSQDVDANGKPIGTNWYITVTDRCRAFMTDQEVAQVPEWQIIP